jgi:hypothetical protein
MTTQHDKAETKRKLRDDLTAEEREKARADRVDRVQVSGSDPDEVMRDGAPRRALSGVMPKRAAAVFAPPPRP